VLCVLVAMLVLDAALQGRRVRGRAGFALPRCRLLVVQLAASACVPAGVAALFVLFEGSALAGSPTTGRRQVAWSCAAGCRRWSLAASCSPPRLGTLASGWKQGVDSHALEFATLAIYFFVWNRPSCAHRDPACGCSGRAGPEHVAVLLPLASPRWLARRGQRPPSTAHVCRGRRASCCFGYFAEVAWRWLWLNRSSSCSRGGASRSGPRSSSRTSCSTCGRCSRCCAPLFVVLPLAWMLIELAARRRELASAPEAVMVLVQRQPLRRRLVVGDPDRLPGRGLRLVAELVPCRRHRTPAAAARARRGGRELGGSSVRVVLEEVEAGPDFRVDRITLGQLAREPGRASATGISCTRMSSLSSPPPSCSRTSSRARTKAIRSVLMPALLGAGHQVFEPSGAPTGFLEQFAFGGEQQGFAGVDVADQGRPAFRSSCTAGALAFARRRAGGLRAWPQ
jgi:hypothetical protein